MPKVHEEILVIKICKLVKNNQTPETIINNELVDAVGSVVEELVGEGFVVEVEKT